jgi:hypothetical protein
MARCEVCIWKVRGEKAYHVAGVAHAGLRLETRAKVNYYITLWNRWVVKNGIMQGIFPSQKTEASKKMGFTKITNRDGEEVFNDERRGTGYEVDYDKDKDMHGRNAFHKDPDYSCNVPIAYDRDYLSGGNNLFGVNDIRIEQFWKKVLDAKPGHPLRRYALISKHNNCCGIVVDALYEGGGSTPTRRLRTTSSTRTPAP